MTNEIKAFEMETIATIKEVLANENYTIRTYENNKGQTVVEYSPVIGEHVSTIVIENTEFAKEVKNLINPTNETAKDIFEKAIQEVATQFEKYYTVAIEAFEEASSNFKPKTGKYQTIDGMEKYYGIVIKNLEIQKRLYPETFETKLKEKALQQATASVHDTKAKIEKKLNGEIAKIVEGSIGQGGNLNGNFYTKEGNGLYFYTIRAEGEIQKPHYRLLSKKIK